ncbi:isocitrate lyase [Rhodotorula toruloides]|uniref:Isocitrate lyase n=1 Tax=Rhodotorula toruloides TaxID=5286 RepID=A0A511KDP8_RHOTO|nr:isocitrate lyase [Rhodotorula toruloides]
MFSYPRATVAVLLAAALSGSLVEAIVITSPTVLTVWDQTGSQPNLITWSLTPETYPPPATPFFDVYIRNGVGSMYTPSLNLRLAESVNALTTTFLEVADAQKFIPGIGYQLFFSDPANPDVVYCDSDIFAIGTTGGGNAGAMSPSSTTTAPDADATSTTTSSTDTGTSSAATDAGTSSTDSASPSSTSSSPLTSAPSSSSTSSPISVSRSRAKSGITAAPVPGGPDEQGFNLVPSGAGRTAVGGATVLVMLAAAALL